MQLGDWQLDTVAGNRYKLDGGAMFGVVPKPLWQRAQPADEQNRIRMAANCLLARDGRHTVLIDTGPGNKATSRERELMDWEPGERLCENLAALGVAPDQVDLVVLSHLHFDHAGGGTVATPAGSIEITFPRARYVVQRGEWQAATGGAPELRGAYPAQHVRPLTEAARLELIEGSQDILPGLRVEVTGGHTRFHQGVLLESRGETALYPCDICPMEAHLRSHWCLAYDVDLLESRRQKPTWLGRAADEGWLVLWCHDPDHAAGRIARDPEREFVAVERWKTL